MKPNYKQTIYACFVGYIVQAIINNFAPLLFLTFQSSYGISLSKITALVSINFCLQLLIDLLSAGFIDKLGYRASVLAAHVTSAAGLISLAFLPELLPDPFVGLLISVMIYAVGGGLLEVLISPIVESCPTDNKEKAMSLLHSFYCWGHVGVVLLSTLFFVTIGIRNWKFLALLWALIPIANTFAFAKAPLVSHFVEEDQKFGIKELFKQKVFWLFMIMMLCSGASEQAVSQWASTFAEQGLKVSKTVGDLAGPMLFAIMMGLSRLYYGKFGDKIDLKKFMLAGTVLCIFSYLVASLSPTPVLGLIGCGLCGLSVGIMWPGTFSMASASLKRGGTALFAFLALAGDLGCSSGPAVVGLVSAATSDNLRMGILAGTAFPVALAVILLSKRAKKEALTQ
ncbi:MAG: MFS transporter [Clostridiales bacterium]|jgi:fucose permease|nr:MFS transporter [Clostridiales bacterium]